MSLHNELHVNILSNCTSGRTAGKAACSELLHSRSEQRVDDLAVFNSLTMHL